MRHRTERYAGFEQLVQGEYGQSAEDVAAGGAEPVVLPALPFKNSAAVDLLRLRALLYTGPELRIYVRRALWSCVISAASR